MELRNWCLLVATLTITHTQTRKYKAGDVIIGVLLPIHNKGEDQACGDLQELGLGFAETLMYTVAMINNNSNLLPGVTLGYDIRDYCDSPTLAMKWTHEFVKNNYMINFDYHACGNRSSYEPRVSSVTTPSSTVTPRTRPSSPIVAVIGAYDSETTVLIAELLQVVEIPLISPFSTSEQLSSPFYSAFFRTIPPDGHQAKAMADILEIFNWNYVASVAVDHSYGRSGIRALEQEAERRKTFCAGIIEFFPRSGYQTKMENIIEKLKKNTLVKVIILWANHEQSLRFLEKAMQQGLHDKVWIISDDLATSSGNFFFQDFADKIHGVFLGVAHHYHSNPSLFQYLQQLPAEGKRHEWWQEFCENEFNCSWSRNSRRLKSCQNLNMNLSEATLDNLYNAFTRYLIDATYTIGYALDKMYKCNSSVHNCPQTKPYLNSKDLVAYIQNISIQRMMSEMLEFDANGNPMSSSYDIVNLQKVPKKPYVRVTIGTWSEKDGLAINASKIKWSKQGAPLSICNTKCPPGTWQTKMRNCCWECMPCNNGTINTKYSAPKCHKCKGIKVPNMNRTLCIRENCVNVKLSSAVGVVITIMAGVGIVGAIISTILFIKFYTTPLIKASNRELSFILLVTIICGFVLSVVHILTPTDAICQLTQSWRYPVHSVSVSILLIKTIRMAGAFQLHMMGLPRCFKRLVVDPRLQVLVLLLLSIWPILLAVLWLSLDSPFVTKEIRELHTEIQVEYLCKSYSGTVGKSLENSSLSYLVLLTLLCIYCSFKARNLPGNFNETKYIGLSLYILLLSWLTYYPINSALEGWYVAIISSATALLSSYGLLGCIFGPKIFIIVIHPGMNTNEFVRAELRSANRVTNSVSAKSH